jgi:hypothetical protein
MAASRAHGAPARTASSGSDDELEDLVEGEVALAGGVVPLRFSFILISYWLSRQDQRFPCPGGERVDVATSCAEVTSPALPVTEPRYR